MNFKKVTALALSAVMMSGVMAGCGKSEESSNGEIVTEITSPVEITFWHAMMGQQQETLQKLTEEFESQNPNITVNLQNQSSYNELNQKLTATMASPKDLPTMTQAYSSWLVTPIEDGMIEDLAPYINNEEIKFDDYEDILEGLRDGIEYGDKIYGLPFNKSTEVIWYNKTIFDELGLEAPKTYEELAEVSKAIYDAKGIPGAGCDSLQNYYTTYLKNEGITFDNNVDPTCQASQDAVNYYLDGVRGGYFRIAGTDHYLSGPFGSQLVGMYIGSTAGESFVKTGAEGKFEVGAAVYPAEYCMQQGTDLYVFSNATAEQKTAAYEYLKFLTSTDSQIEWAISTGYIPVRTSAIKSDEYQNSGSLIAPILLEATENLYANPAIYGANQAFTEASTVLESILATENTDIMPELEKYKTTLESIWE